MKKLLRLAVIGALTVAPFAGHAQLEAGMFFIGGSAYISNDRSATTSGSTTVQNPGETKFGLSPEAGYMLNDRWALLFELGYTTTVSDNQLAGSENRVVSTPSFKIAAGARRYMMLNEYVGLYVDGKLNGWFGSTATKQDNTTTSYSSTTFSATVEPGIACFITDRLMATGQIGYLEFYSSTTETGQDSRKIRNVIGTSLHASVTSIGLSYFF
jgi:hypothetical protein